VPAASPHWFGFCCCAGNSTGSRPPRQSPAKAAATKANNVKVRAPLGAIAYLCGKTAGMEMVSPEAQAYAARYSTAEGKLLGQIAAYTVANHPQAQMLSGHVQGKFLAMISHLIWPRRVLEIGTFMGYSAL
jgi:hypothetical protein